MLLDFAGQPGVVDVAEMDDVRFPPVLQGVGDLLGHVRGHGPRSRQPGPPVSDHDQPGRVADRVRGWPGVERMVALGQVTQHRFGNLGDPVRIIRREVPGVQERFNGARDGRPKAAFHWRLNSRALLAEGRGHGALHQADRRVARQVGHHGGLSPARRGLRGGWDRERGAHLGLRVAFPGDGLRGGRCRLAQLVGAEGPADGFHVLADRIPVVRLFDHVSIPHP